MTTGEVIQFTPQPRQRGKRRGPPAEIEEHKPTEFYWRKELRAAAHTHRLRQLGSALVEELGKMKAWTAKVIHEWELTPPPFRPTDVYWMQEFPAFASEDRLRELGLALVSELERLKMWISEQGVEPTQFQALNSELRDKPWMLQYKIGS